MDVAREVFKDTITELTCLWYSEIPPYFYNGVYTQHRPSELVLIEAYINKMLLTEDIKKESAEKLMDKYRYFVRAWITNILISEKAFKNTL